MNQDQLLHALWGNEEGVRFVCTLARSGTMHTRSFGNTEAAIQHARSVSEAGSDAFFAVALFNKGERKKANVMGLRALFVDIDAGESKPYLSADDAQTALKQFTNKIGLPDPVVVKSGNGIHGYWILPEALSATEWIDLATALRAACVANGLQADHSVTADSARLLRMPGTLNYKNPNEPKSVVMLTPVTTCGVGELRQALSPYIKKLSIDIEAINKIFMLEPPQTPKDANKIADQCPQMNMMRETRGDVPEPHWYAGLGVLALCQDGERLAHEWSEGHPSYSLSETQEKFERARDFAPTTCERFAAVAPELCSGCPHQGTISTPLQLGEITPIAAEDLRQPIVTVSEWPKKPADAAFYGLAGEIVRAIEPHTEADPIALLIQILVAFGSVIGRRAHFTAEADAHYMNLFAVLVGASSKGRKGTSWSHVRRLFEAVDQEWSVQRIQGGLSSGEGLIWAVRDPIEKREPIKEKGRVKDYQTVITDDGVSDKRLLVYEPEIASVLRVSVREGNTVSAIIRQAWDNGNLRTLTKNSPAHATNAHVSIIGHITKDELRRYLDSTDAANGFANRFLWVCARRSKVLPEGGNLHTVDFAAMIQRLRGAVELAKVGSGQMRRDEEARALWFEAYKDLTEGKPGLLGAVTGRAEAQVMRLACLYALLDRSHVVRRAHLEAAIALWRYCEDSARYIFGDSLGDPIADSILLSLCEAGTEGLTRTDISNLFGRNVSASKINRALASLTDARLADSQSVEAKGAGRPAAKWFATRFLVSA